MATIYLFTLIYVAFFTKSYVFVYIGTILFSCLTSYYSIKLFKAKHELIHKGKEKEYKIQKKK